ncbi:MAG TPA: ribosomal protein S18-alanine N-acetyltransferase [Methylophilus sp.]|jgi:ribosomal-protein-alanine N-acetyltransferase|nr:ribosomal protein S18-alanine N-acetyltransferase [Methylophilus sp.]
MSALPQYQPQFRVMSYEDLIAVCRIEPTIYSHPWTYGNFKDSLDSGYCARVMEISGEIVGYALVMMVLDEAHLLNISVAQTHQGQGLGRELLAHMIDISRHRLATNMFLEVRESNTKAIALYEAMGFCEMGIRRNYYPTKSGREDAVLMGVAL